MPAFIGPRLYHGPRVSWGDQPFAGETDMLRRRSATSAYSLGFTTRFTNRYGYFALPLLLLAGVGCEADLDPTRQVGERGTFGEIIYREGCQRVAYTAQLDEKAAGTR